MAGEWLYEIPAEEGWYWWQSEEGDGLHVVHLCAQADGRMGWKDNLDYEYCEGRPCDPVGRWKPIEAPSPYGAWPAPVPLAARPDAG